MDRSVMYRELIMNKLYKKTNSWEIICDIIDLNNFCFVYKTKQFHKIRDKTILKHNYHIMNTLNTAPRNSLAVDLLFWYKSMYYFTYYILLLYKTIMNILLEHKIIFL